MCVILFLVSVDCVMYNSKNITSFSVYTISIQRRSTRAYCEVGILAVNGWPVRPIITFVEVYPISIVYRIAIPVIKTGILQKMWHLPNRSGLTSNCPPNSSQPSASTQETTLPDEDDDRVPKKLWKKYISAVQH